MGSRAPVSPATCESPARALKNRPPTVDAKRHARPPTLPLHHLWPRRRLRPNPQPHYRRTALSDVFRAIARLATAAIPRIWSSDRAAGLRARPDAWADGSSAILGRFVQAGTSGPQARFEVASLRPRARVGQYRASCRARDPGSAGRCRRVRSHPRTVAFHRWLAGSSRRSSPRRP